MRFSVAGFLLINIWNIEIISYLSAMAKDKWYTYLLRLDKKNKKALQRMAKERRNSLNDEINLAVDYWLLKHEEEKYPASKLKTA